jgi:hypothetical protein
MAITNRRTNMVQLTTSKLRENIRKELTLSMSNISPSRLELAISATEPAVAKFAELLTEIFGAMCTPSPAPGPVPVRSDADLARVQREIARLKESVELKTAQVQILREQALRVWEEARE